MGIGGGIDALEVTVQHHLLTFREKGIISCTTTITGLVDRIGLTTGAARCWVNDHNLKSELRDYDSELAGNYI